MPQPKSGRHAKNLILAEDQLAEAAEKLRRQGKARTYNNVFDPDYSLDVLHPHAHANAYMHTQRTPQAPPLSTASCTCDRLPVAVSTGLPLTPTLDPDP